MSTVNLNYPTPYLMKYYKDIINITVILTTLILHNMIFLKIALFYSNKRGDILKGHKH